MSVSEAQHPEQNHEQNHEPYQKFLALDEEKRDRIISAAMKEFLAGYKKASTDNIVREAGISKGLLFHYFGTKECLYRFLVEYASGILRRDFLDLLNQDQRDILEAVWQMSLLKRDISEKHPAIFDFATSVYMDGTKNESIAKGLLEDSMAIRATILKAVYENADLSLFRDDISPERAMKIIVWTMNGFPEAIANKLPNQADVPISAIRDNYDSYLDELREYLEILRKCFYK